MKAFANSVPTNWAWDLSSWELKNDVMLDSSPVEDNLHPAKNQIPVEIWSWTLKLLRRGALHGCIFVISAHLGTNGTSAEGNGINC